MDNRITFRIENDLSVQLKKYCSDNKLNVTEAMNIAVQKLVSRQVVGNAGGQINNAVVDEMFVFIKNLYAFVVNYSTTTLPRIEIENKLSEFTTQSWAHLEKLKKDNNIT